MASRTLVLMRHAKAEGFADDDHARRLTDRGHRDAAAAGAWLAQQGVVPTHALVSSAARTRETWHDVATAAGVSADVAFDDALYSAGPDAALEVLAGADAGAAVLAVVGHNPTVAYVAQSLTDVAGSDPVAFRAMSRGYPTCSVAVLEFDGEWGDIAPGTGRLTSFWSPE